MAEGKSKPVGRKTKSFPCAFSSFFKGLRRTPGLFGLHWGIKAISLTCNWRARLPGGVSALATTGLAIEAAILE
jgi:hypothetical protein